MTRDVDERIYQLHAEVCKSMANPTRLKILGLLRDGEKSVDHLKRRLGLHKANLSQHLSILRQRRIVSARRVGLNIYYQISNPKMIKACDILREVLFEQLKESKQLASDMAKRR